MNDNVRQLNASFKPGKDEKKVDLINEGEEEQMEVYGYRVSAGRQCLAWLGFLATAGLLRLVCHWFPRMLLYLTHCPCSLRDAQKLLCVENYQGKYKMYHIRTFKTISAEAVSSQCAEEMSPESKTLRAYLSNGKVKDLEELRMVSVKKLRYVWDEAEQRLVRLSGLEAAAGYADMHAHSGISDSLRCSRQAVYGLNDIDVPMQSILTLFLLEVVNPLYIFQVFSLIVWFLEGYYYYTMVIVLMSAFGVTSSISQTRKNQRSLHDTVHKTDVVTVDRGASAGGTLQVETTQLVPGDVIVIPPNGCDMYCDAVLLSGSCIVNESMLTGESVPVTKTPLPKTAGGYYNAREDSNHTLFCGTEVMQSRGQKGGSARALVLRTGYLTAKGELVRSILYPPPADFRFDRDVGRFIIVLGIISTCGLIYTIVSKSMRFIRASDIAIKALDLFTIVIPPALPATMTVGKLYGQKRLEKARIFCINSRVINVSGSIDCICFDKTGTLTEDGLDMWGVVEVEPEGRFLQPPARDPQELHDGPLRRGMACCHSLSLIDGEYAGDPLDVRMFEFTKWELVEEEEDVADGESEEDDEDEENLPTVVRPPPGESQAPKEISIVHQFQFSSRLQRMSVVTITSGVQDYDMYCKGSPEMITSLSDPSTVPTGLNETLHEYTSKGYRVIAMGHRRLARSTNLQKLAREDAERDLRFLGIIILENRLKPQTTPVIAELTAARFKIVMITGDNIQTASSVARESGIVLPHETIVEVTARELPTSAPQVYFTRSTIAPPSMPCDGGLSNAAFEVSPGDEETCVGGGGGGGASPYRLAVTGPTWAALRSARQDLLPRVVAAGAIFARMSSDQKQQLVQELKEMGYYVGHHVRRRRERLRRAQGGARGHLAVRGGGVGGVAVHVARARYLVRAADRARGPRRARHLVRHLQVHGRVQHRRVHVGGAALRHRQQPHRLRVPLHRHLPGGALRADLRQHAGVRGAAGAGVSHDRPLHHHADALPVAAGARHRRRPDRGFLRGAVLPLVRAVRLRQGADVRVLRELRRLLGIHVPVHHRGDRVLPGETLPQAGVHQPLPARFATRYDGRLRLHNRLPGPLDHELPPDQAAARLRRARRHTLHGRRLLRRRNVPRELRRPVPGVQKSPRQVLRLRPEGFAESEAHRGDARGHQLASDHQRNSAHHYERDRPDDVQDRLQLRRYYRSDEIMILSVVSFLFDG